MSEPFIPKNPNLPFEEFLNDSFIGDRFEIPGGVMVAIGMVIIGTYLLVNQLFAPWVERKVMARQQGRRGPVHVGWRGSLQIPADLLKLILKEDIRPAGADKVGFFLSILIVGTTAILTFAPFPLTGGLLAGNFSVGILYVFAIFSVFPPFMLVGGWASNSKYALLGGFRSAGQLIAYEIPMFVSILGIIAVTQSFSLIDITENQMNGGWFLFRFWGFGLIAGVIFFLSGYAETERVPFDIPEAEAELVMGPRTEFTGWRYAMIMMSEYLHLFINSLLFIYLFLGGYDPIPIPLDGVSIFGNEIISTGFLADFRTNTLIQFLTITGKLYFMVFIAAWLRSSLARFRIDQLLSLGWKILLPLSLISTLAILGFSDLDVFSYASET
ncbi:MAG: NADH-quinone oxidoreductase subunit H [Candidatus Heimdallarchaeota archaeon LC_2]|nr:MAG: NADH-quinone oxidoreductase subunit H [Candidatus Heimdallarchaeota archaeon LC_2]